MSATTHYDTLEVTAEATDEQVRAAYRRCVRTAHPDVGGDPQEFHRVQAAYDALKTADLRALYERSLREPEQVEELDDIPEWGESVPLSTPATPSYAAPADPAMSYVVPSYAQREALRVPSPTPPYVPFIGWRYWTTPLRAILLSAAAVSVTAAAVALFVVGDMWALAVPLTLWLPALWRLKADRTWPLNVALGVWVAAALLGGFSSLTSLLLPAVVLPAVGASVGVWYPTLVKRYTERKNARARYADAVTAQWTRVDAAARSNAGVLYWIERATPDKTGTDCRVRNAATGEVSSVRLTGQWEPKMWVVVIRGSQVIEYCWDSARKSAGAPHPIKDRAVA